MRELFRTSFHGRDLKHSLNEMFWIFHKAGFEPLMIINMDNNIVINPIAVAYMHRQRLLSTIRSAVGNKSNNIYFRCSVHLE